MNGAPDSAFEQPSLDDLPDFFVKLPGNGPTGRGRLMDLPVGGRAGRFVVFAGSPVRADEVPSLKVHLVSSSRLRAKLKAEGAFKQSERWPGWLELTRDVECSSPSQAAEILKGRSANLRSWKTQDGRPLAEFIGQRASDVAGAWLVRGSSVRGVDLVQRLWLPESVVSLPATRLRALLNPDDPALASASLDHIRRIVEEDYADAETYSVREQLAEDLHAFITLMRPDDQIVTLSGGELRLGSIVGDPDQVESPNGLSNLRRAVEWSTESFDYTELPDELQQLLSVQRDVVNFAKVASLIRGLGVSDQEIDEQKQDDPTLESVEIARLELRLPDPDAALADELLIPRDWLQEVRDLLWDDKQIVLYGPPGTGKTYLAQHLAEYLSGRDPQRVKLVQFHPSYSYEDFFEGFRPREDPKTGNVAFRITAGPLRELAELAAREGNRHIPHFLIIDELNRANLAKVFGELYFLLEYRKRTVRLTYSGDDFGLPPNLFIIGTMNTADRSIALVDAAMRRRFAFIELSPAEEPTKGLLHRWLARFDDRGPEPAFLLDALNARIEDPDFKIGPSYLMKPGFYRDGGLERTWRTKILPLLEEHHYGEGIDVDRRYGLAALRRAISASTAAVPVGVEGPVSPLEQDAAVLLDAASGDDDPEASR